MEIRISSKPVFNFKLTGDQIALLRGLSKAHYDAYCRSVSGVGGFMFGWYNSVVDGVAEVQASQHELDMTLKCLEGINQLPLSSISEAREIQTAFIAAMQRAQVLCEDWREL